MPSAALNLDGQTRALYQDTPYDERHAAQIVNQINNPALMDPASSEALDMLLNGPPHSALNEFSAAARGNTPSNPSLAPTLRDTTLINGQNNPPSNP